MTHFSTLSNDETNIEELSVNIFKKRVKVNHTKFIDFFCPNEITSSRVNTIFSKEPETVEWIDSFENNSVFWDIGANIGYFTCLLAKLVGEDGKVFAFEPDPRNLKLLKRNIQENDYKNVIIIDKAASDVNGPCTLYSAQKKFGANRIFESKKTQTQDFIPIKSETICLDDYFKKQDLLKKIDFIKIDIEGSEFRAFNGMKKILELNNNLKIFTEIAPSLLEDAGSSEKQILDFLQEHEFINFFISWFGIEYS